ncbi:MAG: CehA/McbA family metallohydrolase [Anaerolineae bacterium]|nr:CehA/McbA family metallohydrolase [Anaerolineae bacterium]
MSQPPTGLLVVAASTTRVDEPFFLRIKLLTEPYCADASCFSGSGGNSRPQGRYNHSPRGIRYMDNTPPDWRGSLLLDGGDDYVGPTRLRRDEGVWGAFAGDQRPIVTVPQIRFRSPGIHYIAVTDEESGVQGLSNPIVVSADPPQERLYWGDLHSQTFFSDGLRCPEELYSFARDESFLDIFALADHSESLTDRQWDYFVAVTNDFYQPGRFVTLVGQEWTSREFGHRNVYYPGDGGPILRCNDPFYGRLENVYRAAREHGALVIPHHSANATMGVDWSKGHDPLTERLVEIYSIWGNSERPADQGNPRPVRMTGGEKKGQHVLDALARGYRFGFIGGGDIHDGRPGDEYHTLQEDVEPYQWLWRQGLMGVWALGLTREHIFRALWDRRVYATTNERIFLRVRVGGAPMGSEITWERSREIPIEMEAASSLPFSHLEVVSNGDDVLGQPLDASEVSWSAQLPAGSLPRYYYVRLTRADGEMAWSSPVWVEAGEPS